MPDTGQEMDRTAGLNGSQQPAVLVINCGSSSVKFALIDTPSFAPLMTGQVECLKRVNARLSWTSNEQKEVHALPGADLVAGLSAVMAILPAAVEVVAVGHRVVHGGEAFAKSVRIDATVLKVLEQCSALAPLHNPANIEGIRAAQAVFPNQPHVAVFDTAFHQTLPKHAYLYAVPYHWYEDFGVRRYGFHGTSHRYVAGETARRMGRDLSTLSMVIAHLGNGCSACAIEGGKSMDTSMGFSPLEGLVMGTRSGDIDPALPQFIAHTLGWSLDRIMTTLNQESGLLGISGQSNDMRTLVNAMNTGNERATLAIEIFAYRLAKSMLGLTAALTQLDAIVFTGGIGENSPPVRAKTLAYLGVLGAQIDADLNLQNGDPDSACISKSGSLPCLVVATNEELMIARETLTITTS